MNKNIIIFILVFNILIISCREVSDININTNKCTIIGKVINDNGLPIKGANLFLINLNTKDSIKSSSKDSGDFKFVVEASSKFIIYSSINDIESNKIQFSTYYPDQTYHLDNLIINLAEINKTAWYKLNYVSSSNISQILFIDSNEGWAKSERNILHSNDGGKTWKIIFYFEDLNSINNITFLDSKIGWAVGKNLMNTTDGGKNWNIIIPNIYFKTIKFVDKYNAYLFGSQVYKTFDGGKTWKSLYISKEGVGADSSFYYGGVALDKNNLLVMGISHNYISSDGGLTWKNYETGSARIREGYNLNFIDLKTGLFGGHEGIFKTSDGGLTWKNVYKINDPKFETYIQNIFFINESQAWAVGSGGVILYSSDAGENWNLQKTNTLNTLVNVFFINNKIGWVVGNNGTILKTESGGNE